MKNEHASLVNEHIVKPSIEPPKFDSSKHPKYMDISSCKVCPMLQEDIKSLKSKIEQVSQVSMIFATNSINERHSFKNILRNKWPHPNSSSH